MKMEKRTNKGSRDVIHHSNDNIAPVKEQEARKIKKKEDNLVSKITYVISNIDAEERYDSLNQGDDEYKP